ncbi:MAG: class I SAM-dependent methyltransferase, partial [bacterium]
MNNKKCLIENCDIFDFMAVHVGMTVIHPGGYNATRMLANSCHLNEHCKVIDIACGKGTSAIYLAQKYGCEVIGIDVSEDLIAQAQSLATQNKLQGKVDFRVGDALNLPFSDNEFDVAISQAMLVLVKDKKKAIQEALRVTKADGYLGWLELSWKKPPTVEFLNAVSNVLCAYCMQNVHTFNGWEQLFREAGVDQLETLSFSLGNTGIFGMLNDEGFINTSKVMFKYITNPRIRKRMKTMNMFFKDHNEYFGYGIYTG